jgi:dihydroorotate dehydrogenase
MMPDWTYQTLFKPLLFTLPPDRARALTMGALDALSRLPLGTRVIRFMGHMDPPPHISQRRMNIDFSGPVGLSAALTAEGKGLQAASHFGLGFAELGMVSTSGPAEPRQVMRIVDKQTLTYTSRHELMTMDQCLYILRDQGPLSIPIAVRLKISVDREIEQSIADLRLLLEALHEHADFFILDFGDFLHWTRQAWEDIHAAVSQYAKPFLTAIPADLSEPQLNTVTEDLMAIPCHGVVIDDSLLQSDGTFHVGPASKEPCMAKASFLRQHLGPEAVIIAAGGITEPCDALDMLNAGANLIHIHSGLVFAGPGFPKRINEAAAYYAADEQPNPSAFTLREGWVWILFLGLAMILGGIAAWYIAATSIVLPYDLAFLELTREQLHLINHRLLHFMSHDRITLAGTMMGIGIIYSMLAVFGMRRGLHWAKQAVLYSAAIGFGSFFLYLGFGYFDPLHALVSLMLLPSFILGMLLSRNHQFRIPPPGMTNGLVWKRGQWGQLFAVLLGASLSIGGVVISYVGITHVFVPEDLVYMQTTLAELQAAHPQLVSLIAHDRAGFGGALFSLGISVLLLSLWGIRQGERWIWWAILAAGLPGFIAGFGIHASISYTDLWHLSPAYIVLIFYALALICLYPYLFTSGSDYKSSSTKRSD